MKTVFTVIAVVCAALSAHGRTINYKGVDITKAVEYYDSKMQRLAKPIVVYNWSRGGKMGFWNHDRSPNDPAVANAFKSLSESFWRGFNDPRGNENMMGFGFYAAIDPVETWDYGGGGDEWLLRELRLPSGLKVMDLDSERYSYSSSMPDDVATIMGQFECRGTRMYDFFTNGGSGLSKTCADLIRKIFQDEIKPELLMYGYGATQFKACPSNEWSSRAIVIMRKDWVTSQNVRYYTANSKHDIEDRIRIQTLFLIPLESESFKPVSVGEQLIPYLMTHESASVVGSQTVCSEDSCVITAKLCDEHGNCDSIPLKPIDRPGGGVFTEDQARRTQPMKLLWPDLAGLRKMRTVSEWLANNRMACTGSPFLTKAAQ